MARFHLAVNHACEEFNARRNVATKVELRTGDQLYISNASPFLNLTFANSCQDSSCVKQSLPSREKSIRRT